MRHPVALAEYEGWIHAWVLDLAGCQAGAAAEAQLGAAVALAIAEHETWLRRHGEAAGSELAFEIVERVDARDFAATGGGSLLEADRMPLREEELARELRRAMYAHADLTETLRELPDLILDWDPGDIALGQVDPWAPEARTIRGIVTHNSQLELFYRGALRDGPAPGIFEQVRAPGEERAATIALLRGMDAAARDRVYAPVHPGRSVPEGWTVRKTLRRLISHERHHTAEILQRLAWLLMGS